MPTFAELQKAALERKAVTEALPKTSLKMLVKKQHEETRQLITSAIEGTQDEKAQPTTTQLPIQQSAQGNKPAGKSLAALFGKTTTPTENSATQAERFNEGRNPFNQSENAEHLNQNARNIESATIVKTTNSVAALLKALSKPTATEIVENALKKATTEIVRAPMISLKSIIAKQDAEFAKQFEQPANQEAGNAPDANNLSIPISTSTNIIQSKSLIQSTTQTGMEYDASQDAAIKGMLREQYCCLIGAAGTGKTTTLKQFLNAIEDEIETVKRTKVLSNGEIEETYHLAIGFFAFTGRAVEQMKRALPEKYYDVIGTIHGDKCLTYVPEYYEDIDHETGLFKTKMRFVPSYNEGNKLPYSIIVIDEAGMLAVDLWNILFAALKSNCRVILVGDINQLPPVYGRSILGYAMTSWPVFELTTIHRQAKNNPIIANAHAILAGQKPIAVAGKFNMEDVGDRGSQGTQQHVLKLIKAAHKADIFDPFRDGFIVPQNVGPIGQELLNEYLVTYFNPPRGPENQRQIIKTGMAMVQFAVGDKVMMLANDKENNLTNGQIGEIVSIHPNGKYKNNKGISQHNLQAMHTTELDDNALDDFMVSMDDTVDLTTEKEDAGQRQASHIVTVKFNGKEYPFATAGEFRRLAHAYVITCHKAQGGEYPVVVILIHSANSALLSREWLYTAVTRARERIILVFNQRGLMQALSTQRVKGKTLKEKIESFLKISEADSRNDNAIIPMLPKAKQV